MSRISNQKNVYEILGLNVDLIHLKINIYMSQGVNFAKDYQKYSYNIKNFDEKKIKKIKFY